MTHTLKTLMASLVAATISSAALITPAEAGGQISFTLTPKNEKEEKFMRGALGIYAIVKAVENGGHIEQNGNNNSAGLGQNGSGNFGVVHQDGDGHTGTLTQDGNNNACGVFQFGENTNVNTAQHGDDGTCATIAIGW